MPVVPEVRHRWIGHCRWCVRMCSHCCKVCVRPLTLQMPMAWSLGRLPGAVSSISPLYVWGEGYSSVGWRDGYIYIYIYYMCLSLSWVLADLKISLLTNYPMAGSCTGMKCFCVQLLLLRNEPDSAPSGTSFHWAVSSSKSLFIKAWSWVGILYSWWNKKNQAVSFTKTISMLQVASCQSRSLPIQYLILMAHFSIILVSHQ